MIAFIDTDFSPPATKVQRVVRMDNCRAAREEEVVIIDDLCRRLGDATLDAFRDITKKFWRTLFKRYPDTYADQWDLIQSGAIRLGAFSFDIKFPAAAQAWMVSSAKGEETIRLITAARAGNMRPMMDLLMSIPAAGTVYVIHGDLPSAPVPSRTHVILVTKGEPSNEDQLSCLAQTIAQINSNDSY